jgi:hypothetical protein
VSYLTCQPASKMAVGWLCQDASTPNLSCPWCLMENVCRQRSCFLSTLLSQMLGANCRVRLLPPCWSEVDHNSLSCFSRRSFRPILLGLLPLWCTFVWPKSNQKLEQNLSAHCPFCSFIWPKSNQKLEQNSVGNLACREESLTENLNRFQLTI